MPFQIVRQDITKMNVDAIVNAANTDLRMGGGVCGAIFKAAGEAKLQAACNALAPIKVGGAAITPGFALNAKYVIHAVGPVYSRLRDKKNETQLRSAYMQALTLARENECESIAFPLISSGIYGYPKDKALAVATSAIRDFLNDCDMDVYLAVLDTESIQISTDIFGSVESYIDKNYIDTHRIRHKQDKNNAQSFNQAGLFESFPTAHKRDDVVVGASLDSVNKHKADTVSHSLKKDADAECMSAPMHTQRSMPSADFLPEIADVGGLLDNLDEPMSDTLLRLIDKKGKTDVEVYKKANIDRKLFSKIRTGKGYMPSKRTILALSIALELSLDETDDLLERGGYALSHSQKFDVIVEYFIVNRKYNVFEINEVLFKYDQPLLGG